MRKNHTNQLVLAGLFTALTAIGAFLKIPFPIVPITLQSFFTILAGAILLPHYAALSQISYLILGLAGLPIFANGGGLGYVLQPTFGYLLSLPIAAYFVSYTLNRTKDSNNFRLFLCVLAGLLIILIVGFLWLFFVLRLTMGESAIFLQLFSAGILYFLPGTILKAIGITFTAQYVRTRLK
jgi:biotin transport system substrate-specific component